MLAVNNKGRIDKGTKADKVLKDFINSVSKFESIISEILLPVGIDDNWISIEDKTDERYEIMNESSLIIIVVMLKDLLILTIITY